MKTILVDAVDTLIILNGSKFCLFNEMRDLLDTYSNNKIVLTNANDEQAKFYNLDQSPYEVFSLQHKPDKVDEKYYRQMLEHYQLKASDVVYFEHSPQAVESAKSVGIKTYLYDPNERDLVKLKKFLTDSL